MAKDPKAAPKAAEPAKGGSGMGFIIALVVLTALAGGGGFLFATQVLKPTLSGKADAAVAAKAEDAKGHGGGHDAHGGGAEPPPPPPTGELIPIPTVVASLADINNVFVRLEGTIIVEPGYADAKILAAKVSEDVVALLKSLTLAQLQGSSGLQHLREDINDRVRVRSEGKSREMIINTLVIE